MLGAVKLLLPFSHQTFGKTCDPADAFKTALNFWGNVKWASHLTHLGSSHLVKDHVRLLPKPSSAVPWYTVKAEVLFP